ncbi:hypothetical protein [Flavobacterium sp.]|uniref:hypothetical protein n=1 Tax=Flavobacterium sp. TaxID=239 RepID=UPI0031CFE549
MKQKIKKIIVLSVITLISTVFMRCQKDDDLVNTEFAKVSSAKEWFKKYESTTDNYLLFQNLKYDWESAELKIGKDGTELIVVPIDETKKDKDENWEQKLYIYQVSKNDYKVLLYEFYPGNLENDSVDSKKFTGYIAAWDLKTGFVKSAKFVNNSIVENGVVKVLSEEQLKLRTATNKSDARALDSEDGMMNGSTSAPTQLKEVVIDNTYKDPSVYVYFPTGGDNSGFSIIDYASSYGGASSGGSGNIILSTVLNPCDKIKTLMANPNFIMKMEELAKKTNLKVETGYSQSKNGPFTALVVLPSNTGADRMELIVTSDMIGYVHSHLDNYDSGQVNPDGDPLIRQPIKMFSPADIGIFLQLVKNAQNNKIPIDSVYGAMVSSDGTYQLRFTGDPNQINLNFDWNANSVTQDYTKYLKEGNKEINFLRFLNDKCYVGGIELYKINKNQTSTKKALDTNKKITNINC